MGESGDSCRKRNDPDTLLRSGEVWLQTAIQGGDEEAAGLAAMDFRAAGEQGQSRLRELVFQYENSRPDIAIPAIAFQRDPAVENRLFETAKRLVKEDPKMAVHALEYMSDASVTKETNGIALHIADTTSDVLLELRSLLLCRSESSELLYKDRIAAVIDACKTQVRTDLDRQLIEDALCDLGREEEADAFSAQFNDSPTIDNSRDLVVRFKAKEPKN